MIYVPKYSSLCKSRHFCVWYSRYFRFFTCMPTDQSYIIGRHPRSTKRRVHKTSEFICLAKFILNWLVTLVTHLHIIKSLTLNHYHRFSLCFSDDYLGVQFEISLDIEKIGLWIILSNKYTPTMVAIGHGMKIIQIDSSKKSGFKVNTNIWDLVLP